MPKARASPHHGLPVFAEAQAAPFVQHIAGTTLARRQRCIQLHLSTDSSTIEYFNPPCKSYPPPPPPLAATTATTARRRNQQQQHQQQQRDHHLHQLLRGVAGTSDLLKGCIWAREDLGTAKLRILRSREDKGRPPPRPTPPAMVLHGGSWEEAGGALNGREWPTICSGRGEQRGEEVAAAMEAALPPAQEFADRMAELAAVAPELARSLVGLTKVGEKGKRGAFDCCGALFWRSAGLR